MGSGPEKPQKNIVEKYRQMIGYIPIAIGKGKCKGCIPNFRRARGLKISK